jgi:hypothetical protein
VDWKFEDVEQDGMHEKVVSFRDFISYRNRENKMGEVFSGKVVLIFQNNIFGGKVVLVS